MTDQPRPTRGAERPLSAYGLLMNYEHALSDAVEATIAEGLRRSNATVAARRRAADSWRDPLTFIAAEELSRRLGAQAAQSNRATVSPSSLRRALRPYAGLVATAARTEMASESHEFVAAD
jgi:hypothetical protein